MTFTDAPEVGLFQGLDLIAQFHLLAQFGLPVSTVALGCDQPFGFLPYLGDARGKNLYLPATPSSDQ